MFKFIDKHCVKSVRIRSYFGPHFLAFELNTERYSVSLRIKSECGKMRTKITPNADTFHAVKITRSGSCNSSLSLSLILGFQKPLGVRFWTRHKMSSSHLRERKFKHNFQNTLDLLCKWRHNIETTDPSFLHSHKFMNKFIDHDILKWKTPNWSIVIWSFQISFQRDLRET